MDRLNASNSVALCGTVSGRPYYSHTIKGVRHYSFPLTVPRLSGTEDTINITCTEDLLTLAIPSDESMLRVCGELRSHNNKSGVGNKLQIYVLANYFEFCDAEADNQVFLSGTLCKEPKLRVTPLGREICDLLIAVNRPFGRSDYLPCICWGQSARDCAQYSIGQTLEIEGRIQSREYIKIVGGQQETKIAFEVSAMSVTGK